MRVVGDLQETFKEYDKDNTGKITVEELRKLLMSGSDGLTEDEVGSSQQQTAIARTTTLLGWQGR